MTAENLQNLLAHPYQIAESELESLEELVIQFPYFQLGHLLIAKYAHDQESMLAPQKIRRAAVYARERRLLRRMIMCLPAQSTQEGKATVENLGQALKNTKSFFDLLPAIELDEAAEGYKPNAEKEQEARPAIKELLKEPIETIWENQLSEGDAITLFNEGKIAEAEQLYEKLAKQNPAQALAYQTRWAELTANLEHENTLEHEHEDKIETATNTDAQTTDEADAFFEDIVPEGQPDYLHFNEGLALGLYYDGKGNESMEMYKQLMEIYPDRREYYQEQVITLVGKKAYNAYFTQNIPKKEEKIVIKAEEKIEIQPEIKLEIVENTRETPILEAEKEPKAVSENVKDFFADIEVEPAISKTMEVPQEVYLSEEEKPFFDNIQEVITTPVLEKIVPEIDDEAIFLTESQAVALFNQGKLEDAITVYEQLIKQNPIKTTYYESQIRVLRETVREALRPAKKAVIENKPADNEELTEDLAMRYFSMERTAEAIAVYEQLIEKHPEKRKHYLRQIEVLKS